jgi:hypothetical protein
MPNIYVYSFEDTSIAVEHPSFGAVFSAYGTGIGQVTIAYANDVTVHDVAADLAVIVSKSVKKNGTVTIECLQTSELNSYLMKLTNYIESASPAEFARARITVRNNSTGETFVCTGVSHQKKADTAYASQAQNKSWALMAANIEVN